MSQIKRLFIQVIGWFLFLLGLILAPTPIPIGLLLLLLGAILLLPTSRSFRIAVKKGRSKSPSFNKLMQKVTAKAPKGIKTILNKTSPSKPR